MGEGGEMGDYERLNARVRQLVERNAELGKECDGLLGLLATASAQRDKFLAELECARGDLKTAMEIMERYRVDAERYRTMRDKNFDPRCLSSNEKYAKYFLEFMLCEERLDAAVDLATIGRSEP
jgi:Tfp pilus assembly protein PilE